MPSTTATSTVTTPAAIPLPPPVPPVKPSKPTIPAPARNAALMAMADDDDDGVCVWLMCYRCTTLMQCVCSHCLLFVADWDKADAKDAKSSQPQPAAGVDDAASAFSEESGFDVVDEEAAAEAEKHQVRILCDSQFRAPLSLMWCAVLCALYSQTQRVVVQTLRFRQALMECESIDCANVLTEPMHGVDAIAVCVCV